MGRRSQERMTGLCYEERVARAKRRGALHIAEKFKKIPLYLQPTLLDVLTRRLGFIQFRSFKK